MQHSQITDSLVHTWDAMEIGSPRESIESDWAGAQLKELEDPDHVTADLPLAA